MKAGRKIKECPFCDARRLTIRRLSGKYRVECHECGAMGPYWYRGMKDRKNPTHTENAAIRAWNTAPRQIEE